MRSTITTCPVCDQGTLREATYSDQFKHGKHVVTVNGLEGYLCSVCDAEPILPKQIRRNQIKITDAKRQRLGLLTVAEIKSIRKELGLTQKKAATIFGGGANAFSKYERGDVLQSEPMDKLLRVVADIPQAFVQLQRRAES